MKKLKIYSFPDKNPEYLQLQIDSYRKNMEDPYTELIIVNASTEHRDEVNKICSDNNINCIEYTGENNGFLTYYVDQLSWFRDNIQSKISDYILLIHSDMFFIDRMDYRKLMEDKRIVINPQYRKTHSLYYMWDGVLLFDSEYFNSNDLTRLFIWDSVKGVSDMGGKTCDLLKTISPDIVGFFEFWTVYNINGNVMESTLNGNIWYTFDMTERKIREQIPLDVKSFDYEDEKDDYNEYYINKIMEVKENFSDRYNFPSPVYFDVIQIKDGDLKKSPILHLKSGSGYQSWYNTDYVNRKISELRKVVEDRV